MLMKLNRAFSPYILKKIILGQIFSIIFLTQSLGLYIFDPKLG